MIGDRGSSEESEILPSSGPQLFIDAPNKTLEALEAFSQLETCNYANKTLGNSNQDEQMTCDCREEFDGKHNRACGKDSDCINRLTSVECINGDCSCGDDCQNQRFQRKQYAKVSVIQTEKKGYGLRADKDIPADSFIYEYIGEVIDEASFRTRMVKYDEKGFKHFYFMMLQKNEFIDATMKGCLARFCNHSCRPNAFVDKWVVGKKLKMGIFSKRKILKGEEITFDYNVDRYGAQAQPCYCGESNCIGFMGGKTQTDSASLLPQVVAEALGVTPSEEKSWLKMMKLSGRKIKKNEESNINEEFIASLKMKPLESEDVSKVMSALLRSQENIICRKLVERIWLTSDNTCHTRVIRMHGYEIFSKLVRDNWADAEEQEMTIHILEILSKWPKITKNKISSSKIETVLKDVVANTENKLLKDLASSLLDEWSSLEMAYRIPKRSEKSPPAQGKVEAKIEVQDLIPSRVYDGVPLPTGWEWAVAPDTNKVYFYNRELNVTQWNKPVDASLKLEARSATPLTLGDDEFSLKRRHEDEEDESHKRVSNSPMKALNNLDEEQKLQREKLRLQRELEESKKFRELRELEYQKREEEVKKKAEGLNSIILKAQKEAEEKKLAEQRLREQEEELKRLRLEKKLKQKLRSELLKSEKLANLSSSKEKLYKRLFAGVVPNMIKKYESEVGHENIKRCAKDIVTILTEKELKRHADAEVPKELNNEKKVKIKMFSKSYMAKFLVKYKLKETKKKPEDQTNNEISVTP